MIPHKLLNIVFLLSLALAFISAGCVSTTTETAGTSSKLPAENQQEKHPGAVYEAGDEIYPAGYYIHTVTLADESISIIAKWFTGDLKNWEVLAKCNPNINPNRIFLGNAIRIPRSIMTRQDPMTAEFVQEAQPKPKRKPKPTVAKKKTVQEKPDPVTVEPETVPEEEPLLFGPKGYSKKQ